MTPKKRTILLILGILFLGSFYIYRNLEFTATPPLEVKQPTLPDGATIQTLPTSPNEGVLLGLVGKYVYIDGACLAKSYAVFAELNNPDHLFQLCWWKSSNIPQPLPILLGEISLPPDSLKVFRYDDFLTNRESFLVQVKNPPRDSSLGQHELPNIKYENMHRAFEGGPSVLDSPVFLVGIENGQVNPAVVDE